MSIEQMPTIRILIADDHEMVRQGIRSWLEKEPDFQVVAEARRGLEIELLLAQFEPDVLLLDLHFPDMHGLDIIRKLRKERNDIPILVMTGYERQRAKA